MDSMCCTKRAMLSPEFQHWMNLMQHKHVLHRKLWEWCFIAQALREHGMLISGKFGLGFGVGRDPLTSLFASLGARILATDLDTKESAAAGWAATSQHSDNKNMLNLKGICRAQQFESLVEFEFSNMNYLPQRYIGRFDFIWSSCALEHLGSLENGVNFILNSIDCLKPGGIAVHTTEFNLSSNSETLETGLTVLFRRKDIEGIVEKVKKLGCHIHMDWNYGDQPEDYHVDVPPYSHDPHLKLLIAKYIVTSIGIVIIKPI